MQTNILKLAKLSKLFGSVFVKYSNLMIDNTQYLYEKFQKTFENQFKNKHS